MSSQSCSPKPDEDDRNSIKDSEKDYPLDGESKGEDDAVKDEADNVAPPELDPCEATEKEDETQEHGQTEDDPQTDPDEESGEQDPQGTHQHQDSDKKDHTDDNYHEEPNDAFGIPSEEAKQIERKLQNIQDSSVDIITRLEKVTELMQEERDFLKSVHFKEYNRLDVLKSVLEANDKVLVDYEDQLMVLHQHMKNTKDTLHDVTSVIDKKLTNEGLISWLRGERAHPADTDGVAKEQQTLAEAAQARSHAAEVHKSLLKAEERASLLEAEALEAISKSQAAEEAAKTAAIAAEEAKQAAEERRKIEEEARLKVEEENRRKEEEERKKAEEEERRKRQQKMSTGSPEEQERMRKEQERKDPKNWPNFAYSVDGREINIPVGCVIRAMPGSMQQGAVTVTSLDQRTCPVSLTDNEELVSNIIEIQQVEDVQINEPISVAIPQLAPRNVPSRECVIKKLNTNGSWSELETRDAHFEDIKDYKFVEARLRSASETLAVVTRPKRETLTITKRGGKSYSTVDTRICFAFKPVTFKVPTDLKLEILPVDLNTVSDLKYRKPVDCQDLLASSPMVSFALPGNRLPKPMMINIPVPPNPNKVRRPHTAAAGDKADKNKGSSGRPTSAIIASYQKEEEAEDNLHLVTKSPTEGWLIRTDIALVQSKGKDIVVMEVCHPIPRFMILRTKSDATPRQVETIATTIDDALKERAVQMILRQRSDNPSTVTLQCVPVVKSERYQRNLAEEGYDMGPAPSDDLILVEGQKLSLRFRGNIKDSETENNDGVPSELVFNSQISTKIDFEVNIIDKFAQKSLDTYRGFAQIFTKTMTPQQVKKEDDKNKTQTKIEIVEKDVLLCEMLINLPKPEPESPKPIVNRTPVNFIVEDILDSNYLRQIASCMGEEWKVVAQHLGVRRVRLQAIMRNCVTKNNEEVIYEMLATWAKKIPRSMNKVDVLCTTLLAAGRSDLVEEIKDKELDLHQQKLRAYRVAYLQKAFIKIAQSLPIMNEWRRLGRGLGLGPEVLDDIDYAHPGIREKVVTCLNKWLDDTGESADVLKLFRILRRCRWGKIACPIFLHRDGLIRTEQEWAVMND